MPQKMHGNPLTAPHDGWNGSHAPAATGSIARINRRVPASAATAINRRARRCGERNVFSLFASLTFMIAAAGAAKMSRAVRRASAIQAVLRSAAVFQKWVASAVAAAAPEAQASSVERRELEQSDLPTHPNQIRTGERKGADTRSEKHKAAVG